MKRDFKYKRIYKGLRDKIQRGEYAPGERIPSQRRLMADYGVSFATITSSLKTLAQEGLIVSYQGRGTFVTDETDGGGNGGFRVEPQVALGLLMPGMSSHPGSMLKGVYEQAHEMNAKLEFILFEGENERRRRCREILDGEIDVDGCLIRFLPGYDDVVAEFNKHDFPYIILDAPCVHDGVHAVLNDHAKGAKEAVNHLIRHGHERIAYVGQPIIGEEGEPNSWLKSKSEGYLAALEEAGLEVDPELMIDVPSDSYDDACRAAKALLDRAEFSGVFVSVGNLCVPVMDVLRAEGKRIPLDTAVVSFNVNEHAELADEKYSVTGIRSPRIEIGKTGVRALTQLAAGNISSDGPCVVEVPMEFVRRRSCGCA